MKRIVGGRNGMGVQPQTVDGSWSGIAFRPVCPMSTSLAAETSASHETQRTVRPIVPNPILNLRNRFLGPKRPPLPLARQQEQLNLHRLPAQRRSLRPSRALRCSRALYARRRNERNRSRSLPLAHDRARIASTRTLDRLRYGCRTVRACAARVK